MEMYRTMLDYDDLFNHFACKDLCYELMPKTIQQLIILTNN